MFIDYVTLMLVNMSAGLFLLACFTVAGLHTENGGKWVPAFAIAGVIATATGLHMSFTWPLIQSYNIPFGELSVMLGLLFLGLAASLHKGWTFGPLTAYAFFAGLAAVVVGLRIKSLGLTLSPGLACAGFVLSGLGGVLALPVYLLRKLFFVRWAAAAGLLIAAIIWAIVGYGAYWAHLDGFRKWQPIPMRSATAPAPAPEGSK